MSLNKAGVMMGDYKQYLSVSEVAKMLSLGKSTLSKKLAGTSIKGVIRDAKIIKIDPEAIPEIKKMLGYNDKFNKMNFLSTNEVAKYLKSLGINAKRTDISNWIRSKNISSILHMGYRYIEQSECVRLAQLIKNERMVPSGYYSIEDAAKLIKVFPGTIAKWASDGDIESKFVVVDHYKRLYVATDKLSDVKLRKSFSGLKNLQNANIEKLKKQSISSITNRKIKFNGKNDQILDTTQKWLTTYEVGQMLNITYKTVQAFLRQGKFPNAIKDKNVWFISESDALNYQQAKTKKSGTIRGSVEKLEIPEEYLKVNQVAALLNVKSDSIYTLIQKGSFPSAKKINNNRWIIHEKDIEKYRESKHKHHASKIKKSGPKLLPESESRLLPPKRIHRNRYPVTKEFVPPEGYMKVEQLAELLNQSKAAITKMIRSGLFPTARKENRYWIITSSDFDEYLKNKDRSTVKFGKHEVIQELLDYLASVAVSHVITKTHQLYCDYAQTRLNATGGRSSNLRRVLNHLKKLYREIIHKLPSEIHELSYDEIEAILTNHIHSSPVREHYVLFLKYSYQTMGIEPEREYMFSRKHKSNETKIRDDIYSPDIYRRFEHHVKQIDEHIKKAKTDRYYANMWVMVTMLLTNAWRPSDIIFEMPRLDVDVVGVNSLEWFQHHKLSLQDCQMIINQLYLKLRDVNVSKTNATLHFLVAPDIVECLATACVLSELHCRTLDSNMLEDKRRLLGTFIVGSQPDSIYAQTSGQEAHMRFLETDPKLQPFSSRKLNNSTMTYLFFDITEDDQDNAELAIEIPKWVRSHEDVNTTAVYIKVTNKDGSMDRVAMNLFKRGHFGWLYNFMVRLACSQQGHAQKLEERTATIQALRTEYTPIQLEGWAKSVIQKNQGRETVIQRLSKMPTDFLKRLIIEIYKGNTPSRDGCGQCLRFPECEFPQRKTCIGCPEFIPQVQEVMIEARREFFRLIESIKNSHSETIIQRDSFFLYNILLLFQEATQAFGVDTVNGFISADLRKESLFNIADKIKIDR
ncbi:helix-turn-helix domain-containing protein [Paenibacillus sp. Dod16]